SPEHARPDVYGEPDAPADVFALGILLFMLLFKKHPFEEGSEMREALSKGAVLPSYPYHRDVVSGILAALCQSPWARPSAGRLFWVLCQHRETNYLDTDGGLGESDEADDEPRLCVVIESLSSNFTRTYYEDTMVGRNELRGSGIREL